MKNRPKSNTPLAETTKRKLKTNDHKEQRV